MRVLIVEDQAQAVLDRREERSERRISPNCTSERPRQTPSSSDSTTPLKMVSPREPRARWNDWAQPSLLNPSRRLPGRRASPGRCPGLCKIAVEVEKVQYFATTGAPNL